jgi:hypothetical protein
MQYIPEKLFVENAKNKAFFEVATLVADHSARWSALGSVLRLDERNLTVKCFETDLIE